MSKLSLVALAVAAHVSCGPSENAGDSRTPLAVTLPSASASLQASAPAASAGTAPPVAVVPAFLTAFDAAAFPLRVLYKPRDTGAGWPLIVIDPGGDRTPPLPRILCDEPTFRIAVYTPTSSLATVALDDAVMVASAPLPPKIEPLTPSVRFEPGTLLELAERAPGATTVGASFEGFMVRAEGQIEKAQVGHVYRPRQRVFGPIDAELPRGGAILDAPHGKPLARLEPPPPGQELHFALKLGPVKNGHVLIRYETGEATVVGWIPRSELRDVPRTQLGGLGESGGGSGWGISGAIELPKGTRFLDGDAVIGLVLQNDSFPCVGDCFDAVSTIEIPSCAGNLTVRAVRP